MNRTSNFLFTTLLSLVCLHTALAQEPGTVEYLDNVCAAYSEQIGVAEYRDKDEVYQKRYFTVLREDDENAKIAGFRWCLDENELLFKGFQVQFQTSNGLAYQEYGTMDAIGVAPNCYPSTADQTEFQPVTDEIVKWAIYADSNDVEGLRFITENNDALVYKANYNIYKPDPPGDIGGRLIGFRIEFGHTAKDNGNTKDQPMKVQVIYNSCMCPLSVFTEDAQPANMEIEAVVSEVAIQNTLQKQGNTISTLFGQDCGTYSVRLESNPPTTLVTVSSDGGDYIDRMQLAPAALTDIGVYDVTMVIESDGYDQPLVGALDSISYQFTVTVNPCIVTDVSVQPSTTEIVEHNIGEPSSTFGPYSFTQSPACGYETTITVSTLPDFVQHDEENKSFIILDTAEVGTYTIEVTERLERRTSAADPSQTDVTLTVATYELKVYPCVISEVTTPVTIDTQNYSIRESGFNFGEIFFETDNVACDYTFSYEMTGAPANLAYTEPANGSPGEFVLSATNDLATRGEYTVKLTGSVSVSDGKVPETITNYSADIAFTLRINPCQISDYSVNPVSFNPIEYDLGDAGFTFGSYEFTQYLACGYDEVITVTGLPSSGFIEHRTGSKDFSFTSTSDSNDVGLYQVSLIGEIQVPDDYTAGSATSPFTKTVDFEVRVNPCQVDSLDVVDTIEEQTYVLGEAGVSFGPYTFQQTPSCGYEQDIVIENLPSDYMTHSSVNRNFNIATTSNIDFIGEYTIKITSTVQVPDYLGTLTPVSQSIEFTLTVTPCVVTDYQIVSTITGPIVYTLGDPLSNFGPYEFLQNPNCGYEESLTILNLPELYVSHDTVQRDFTIPETIDVGFLGTKDVTITSTFQQIQNDKTTVANSATISFQLIVGPCVVTEFKAVSDPIADKLYSLDEPGFTLGPYAFSQSPDCGYAQVITFEGLPDEIFIEHDSVAKTLTVAQTSDLAFLGIYNIVIRSTYNQLESNGETTPKSATIEFKLTVSGCIVDTYDITDSPPATVAYTLGDEGFTFGTYGFAQNPACGYPETVEFENSLPAEQYFTHNAVDKTFSVLETTDPDFLGLNSGVYDIVIVGSFLQRNVDGSQTKVESRIEFQLTVSPCIVDSYDVTVRPEALISYVLGSDGSFIGSYGFAQNPDGCGYTNSVTTEGIPVSDYIILNQVKQVFFITETTVTDIEFLGVYDIIITSQFEQLNADKSTTPVTQTIDFQITVSPCIVDQYDITETIDAEINYTLDEPGFTFGPYGFAQNPAGCAYEETLILVGDNLPSELYMTHDTVARTFTIVKTAAIDFLGEYNIIIRSSFDQVLQDKQTEQVVKDIAFKLTVSPCQVDSYDITDTIAAEIGYTLDEPGFTFGPYGFAQNPSDCAYLETLEVTGLPDQLYMTHDTVAKTFTIIETTDIDFLGIYDVVITSQFEQLNQDKTTTPVIKTIEFQLTVSPCIVTSFDVVSDPIDDVTYTLDDPAFQFGAYEFAQTPNCGYPVTINVEGLEDVGQYVTHDTDARIFDLLKTKESAFVGIYNIKIVASYEQMQIDQTPVVKTQEIEFKLTVSPCVVTDFIVTSASFNPQSYILGNPTFDFGPYEFVQQPNCEYPQTITFTNLPELFVTHDSVARDFEIERTLDSDFLGQYETVITSTFDQPQIEGASIPQSQEIQFTIVVLPCQVSEFTSIATIADQDYTLGDTGRTFGSYGFQQSPDCEYVETITIEGLPDFVTHRPSTKDFIVTENQDFNIQEFTVVITSTIKIPIDNSDDPAFRELTATSEFKFTVINPCLEAQLASFSIPYMFNSVNAGAQVKDILSEVPQDSVSQVLGDQSGYTFCGERQFRITSTGHENYLSYNELTYELTILSASADDIGTVKVTMEAYLVDYPAVTKTSQFDATITDCQVVGLQDSTTDDQTYDIFQPALVFTLAEFVQVPACKSPVDYSIEISTDGINFSSKPSWITQNDRELTVQTNDFDLINLYTIRVNGITGVADVEAQTTFELALSSPQCEAEELSNSQTLDSIEYQINLQDPELISVVFESTVTDFVCPHTYSLTIIQNEQVRNPTDDDLTVITFNDQDGSLTISTVDFKYDAATWILVVTKTSRFSTQAARQASIEVEVSFRDVCWDSILKAPEFVKPSRSFILYFEQKFYFEIAEDLSQDPSFCGGFEYELIYQTGPLQGDSTAMDIYTISEETSDFRTVTGTANQVVWYGTHTVIVKGTLGDRDLSAGARGQNGLFGSVFSDPMTIIITNPCFETVLDFDNSLNIPSTLAVPLGDASFSQLILGPKDSVSYDYGDGTGYDLCGARQFEVYREDGSVYFNDDLFSLVSEGRNEIGADIISLQLNSYREGPILTTNIIISVYLLQYPEKRVDRLVVLEYRECVPYQYQGKEIGKQRIELGQDAYGVNLSFNQSPCAFSQVFSAVSVNADTGNEGPLPSFMTLLTSAEEIQELQQQERRLQDQVSFDSNAFLYFNKTTSNDKGDYKIRIYDQLQNINKNVSAMLIEVQVFELGDIDWSLLPGFNVSLTDQEVEVGGQLFYKPIFYIIQNGWAFNMTVNLGRSNKFMNYDKKDRAFRSVPTSVENIDIGSHRVVIRAEFTSPDGRYMLFEESFLITVVAKVVCPDCGGGGGGVPPKPPIVPVWDGVIIPNLVPEIDTESEEDLKNRPVPYISSVTETGLLTIGWDRRMEAPDDYQIIPSQRVAVLDVSEFSKEDQDERLQFGWYRRAEDTEALYLALIAALEVRITREDPDAEVPPIEFTWDILGYNSRFLQIQLEIKNPESIGDDFGEPDNLSVTFWGTKYFKSQEGVEVGYGSEVTIKIIRQISASAVGALQEGLVYIKAYIIAIVLSVVAFFSVGSLLPMWMFVNSLQIITHSALLNTMMPGNVFTVLREYLGLVRLNWPALDSALYDRDEYREDGYEHGLYNIFLGSSGYVHLFGQNLVIITTAGIVILIVWSGLAAKDWLGRRGYFRNHRFFTQSHEPYAANFALRFFYEIFLELCLCILLNLAITEFDSFSVTAQWVLSLIVAVGIVVYIAWLVSLFFYNGPFLEKFYDSGTWFQSHWMARPINDKFHAQQKLNALNTKRLREQKRAIKQQKKRMGELLQTTARVTPIQELDNLGTERPLMMTGRSSGVGLMAFPTDRMSGVGLEAKEPFGDDLQKQGHINTEHSEQFTENMVATHVPLRTDQSGGAPIGGIPILEMPKISELSSSLEKNTAQRQQEQPQEVGNQLYFDEEMGALNDLNWQDGGRASNQGMSKMGGVIAVLDQEITADDHNVVKIATMSKPGNFDGDDSSLENLNIFNRGTGVFPSRQTNRPESISPTLNFERNAMGSRNCETPYGDTRLSFDANITEKPTSNFKRDFLAENSLNQRDSMARPQSVVGVPPLFTIDGSPEQFRQGMTDQKPGPGYIETPAFPSAFKHSSLVDKELLLIDKTPDSKHNSGQIGGSEFQEQQFFEGGSQEESELSPRSSEGSFRRSKTLQQSSQGMRQSMGQDLLSPQRQGTNASYFTHSLTSPDDRQLRRSSTQQIGQFSSPRALVTLNSPGGPTSAKGGSSARKRRKAKKKKKDTIVDPKFKFFVKQKTCVASTHRKEILERKKTHERIVQLTAKEMIAGADLITKPKRFKTLYYGLRLNHPRNVALVHPLMFAFRRIFYALAIVLLGSYPLFGVWILLAGTVAMIALAVTEHPWEHPIINHQHIFNEFVTYFLCIFLLLFNGFVGPRMRLNLGYVLIGLISIFLVYNGVIMLMKITRLCQLLLRKWRVHRRQGSLRAEANQIKKKIQLTLDEISKARVEAERVQIRLQTYGSDEEDPEDEENAAKVTYPSMFKLDMTQVATGGLRMEIAEDQIALELLRNPPIKDNSSEELRNHLEHDFQWQLKMIEEVDESQKEAIEDSQLSDNQGGIKLTGNDENSLQRHSQEVINADSLNMIEEEIKERPQSVQNIALHRLGSDSQDLEGQMLDASAIMKSGATLGNIAEMRDDEEMSPGTSNIQVKPLVTHVSCEVSGSVVDSLDEEEPKPDELFETKRWFQPDILAEDFEKFLKNTDERTILEIARASMHGSAADLIASIKARRDSVQNTPTLVDEKVSIGAVKDSKDQNEAADVAEMFELELDAPHVVIIETLDENMDDEEEKEEKNLDDNHLLDPSKRLGTNVSLDRVSEAGTVWASPEKHSRIGDQVTENTVVLPNLSHHINETSTSQANIMMNSFGNNQSGTFRTRGSKLDIMANLTAELSKQQINEESGEDEGGPAEILLAHLQSSPIHKDEKSTQEIRHFMNSKERREPNQSNLNISNLLPETPDKAGEEHSLVRLEGPSPKLESDIASEEVSRFLELNDVAIKSPGKATTDNIVVDEVVKSGSPSGTGLQARVKQLLKRDVAEESDDDLSDQSLHLVVPGTAHRHINKAEDVPATRFTTVPHTAKVQGGSAARSVDDLPETNVQQQQCKFTSPDKKEITSTPGYIMNSGLTEIDKRVVSPKRNDFPDDLDISDTDWVQRVSGPAGRNSVQPGEALRKALTHQQNQDGLTFAGNHNQHREISPGDDINIFRNNDLHKSPVANLRVGNHAPTIAFTSIGEGEDGFSSAGRSPESRQMEVQRQNHFNSIEEKKNIFNDSLNDEHSLPSNVANWKSERNLGVQLGNMKMVRNTTSPAPRITDSANPLSKLSKLSILDPIEENKGLGRAVTMRNKALISPSSKVYNNIIPEATKDDEMNDLPYIQMVNKQSTFIHQKRSVPGLQQPDTFRSDRALNNEHIMSPMGQLGDYLNPQATSQGLLTPMGGNSASRNVDNRFSHGNLPSLALVHNSSNVSGFATKANQVVKNNGRINNHNRQQSNDSGRKSSQSKLSVGRMRNDFSPYELGTSAGRDSTRALRDSIGTAGHLIMDSGKKSLKRTVTKKNPSGSQTTKAQPTLRYGGTQRYN